MGITALDIAVVTHRHFDHHGGMDEVIRATPPDLFVGVTEDCPNRSSDDRVRTALTGDAVTIHTLSGTPEVISIDGVNFTKKAQDAPPLAVGRNGRSWDGRDAQPKKKGKLECSDGLETSSAYGL